MYSVERVLGLGVTWLLVDGFVGVDSILSGFPLALECFIQVL